MPRPFFDRKRRGSFRGGPPAQRQATGRCDAAGDAALEFSALALGETIRFDAGMARRLLRREVNPKEAFTARDATGVFYRASLKELSENGGAAVIYEKMAVSPEPSVEITLACAVLARQRMIFVAQKATELGVARIVPLFTERSVPPQGLEHEKAHAWPGQLIRAAKQCRRSSLPELLSAMTLDAFLASPSAQAELCLCLDDVGASATVPVSRPKRILLITGPEGGFSDSERKKLEGHAVPWSLGGRILRAETAVLAGLTAVQLRWGDFRSEPWR